MRFSKVVSILSMLIVAACKPASAPDAIPTTAPAPTQSATSTPAPSPTPVPQVGTLEGRVSIGPLTPVERVGVPTPIPPPEVYAARSINIFQTDGKTLVANVKINPDGTYRVELKPGTYVVNIARTGLDRGTDLPKTITIVNGQTTHLVIDIDTGIR